MQYEKYLASIWYVYGISLKKVREVVLNKPIIAKRANEAKGAKWCQVLPPWAQVFIDLPDAHMAWAG